MARHEIHTPRHGSLHKTPGVLIWQLGFLVETCINMLKLRRPTDTTQDLEQQAQPKTVQRKNSNKLEKRRPSIEKKDWGPLRKTVLK